MTFLISVCFVSIKYRKLKEKKNIEILEILEINLRTILIAEVEWCKMNTGDYSTIEFIRSLYLFRMIFFIIQHTSLYYTFFFFYLSTA